MKIFKAAGMVTVSLALACSGSNQVASEYVKSSAVTSAQGATLSVDASDNSALAGASLSVSPRALDSDTTLHVALGKKNINESDQKVAGPVAIWSPADTHFNYAAKMTLPVTGSSASIGSLEVEVEHADKSTMSLLPTDVTVESSRTLATFWVDELGSYQVVSAQACNEFADAGTSLQCRNGKVCIDGYCRRPSSRDGGSYGVPDGGDDHDGGSYDWPDGGDDSSDGGIYAYPDGGDTFDGGSPFSPDGGSKKSKDGGF